MMRMYPAKLSSDSMQQIVRKQLPSPLTDGILLSSKIIPRGKSGNGMEFSKLESRPVVFRVASDEEKFSVVVGRMEMALNTAEQFSSSSRSVLPILHGKDRVQKLIGFVHRQLKKELLGCPPEDQKRKKELISNIEGFCLGNGIGNLGIPAPEYALSFSESAEMVSRIAGLFVFRKEPEGASFDYIPLGRGSMYFLEDTDGTPCLNIRKTAIIKVSPDRKIYFDDETKEFLSSIGVPLTFGGLHVLQGKPYWWRECPARVHDEIALLAMANNIMLPSRQSMPFMPSEEITRVERISERPGIRASDPTKIDIILE